MKIIHVADLHFGKSLHNYSMIDNGDQPFWVERFLELVDEERPDVVAIAGDVYDRQAPGSDAVELLGSFLSELVGRGIQVMMIAGNHDSASRLSFLDELLEGSGLYISGKPNAVIKHRTVQDEHGDVVFWLVPYVYPAMVATLLEDDSIHGYDEAMRRYLEAQDVDFGKRNIIIAHQNVLANGVAAERGGSETMVGGVGEIDYTAFDGFDYVALGHIHKAQAMGRDTVRYAGSPMCYHFSEARNPERGVVIVNVGAKGDITLETRTLPVLHKLVELKGEYDEVLQKISGLQGNEYIRVELKGESFPQNAVAQLHDAVRARGSYMLEIANDYSGRAMKTANAAGEAVEDKSIEELFADFYMEHTSEMLDSEGVKLAGFIADQVRMEGSSEFPTDKEVDAILKFVREMEA